KSVAWGNTNRGNTVRATTPLERTFRIHDLDFGDPPRQGFGRLSTNFGGFSLQAVDFFNVAIRHNGRLLHIFKTPSKGDRIYSFTLLPGGRAIIGASFSLCLVDLRTNKIQRYYHGHSGIIHGVCPSPDAKYFVTGSSDQTLCLWD